MTPVAETPAWAPDVLGDEFEQLTLPLGSDDEGEVVATLVRALPRRSAWQRALRWALGPGDARELADTDVLYVHGWSDYFFQKRLARFWTGRGARFFALDLRKYGRSLRPGQTPGYISDLASIRPGHRGRARRDAGRRRAPPGAGWYCSAIRPAA